MPAVDGVDDDALAAAIELADEGCPFSALLRRAGATVNVSRALSHARSSSPCSSRSGGGRRVVAGVSRDARGTRPSARRRSRRRPSSPSAAASENASSIVCTGPAGTPAAVSRSRHSRARPRREARFEQRRAAPSRCRTRSSFEANRSSATSSGSPSASRQPLELPVVAGEHHQVAVRRRYVANGSMLGCVLPSASGTTPLASQPADWFASIARFACSRSIVTRWPRPISRRA